MNYNEENNMIEKSNMTIIGGTRGLGRWIAEHLNDDFNITITSRNKTTSLEVLGN